MELNQTVTTLQDEIKLLKGEIKTVLKEIRAAVLTADNPFVASTGTPKFRVVERPRDDDDEGSDQGGKEEDNASETPAADLPGQPPGGPPLGGPGQPPGGPPLGGPGQPPGGVGMAESAALHDDKEPIPLRPDEEEHASTSPLQWNLLTIASLTAWAEDAVKTLGPQRFQIVLELAGFAELLSPDVREVLSSLAELTPARESKDAKARPMNVNECLVILHQLQAILQGETVTRLRKRRGGRHIRVR